MIIGYENVLQGVRAHKPRAQTAQRRKKAKKFNINIITMFGTPVHKTNSPIHDSLYLSRKNSYERQFDRPEVKDDIKIVGRNIKEYIKELRDTVHKDMPIPNQVSKRGTIHYKLDIGSKLPAEPPSNKINLVLESSKNIKNNQSNDTYSAVVTETNRKTPNESYRSRKLVSRVKRVRLNSSPFANHPLPHDPEAENKMHIANESEVSKMLYTNIRNIYKSKNETIHSRESEFKNRTKDSQEYSYGNDLRKMEPKIKDFEAQGMFASH